VAGRVEHAPPVRLRLHDWLDSAEPDRLSLPSVFAIGVDKWTWLPRRLAASTVNVRLGGLAMAWKLDGTYFESCSCDTICPCTWSALTAKATLDRCRALLGYHVQSGEIDGVNVSGLNFALFLDTPPVMAEGNWRVGVFLDAAADDNQAQALGGVLSGQQGGPPAMLGPLIGEMLGVERARIEFGEDGRSHQIQIGDGIKVRVEDFVAIEGQDPVRLTNVFHPSNTTLTVAPAKAAALSTFGIDWGREGQSGFSAPFSWSG
jgi:hypothetical protein